MARRRNVLIKVVVGIVALGALGVLFVRSAQSTRAEPYTVTRDRLAGWTVAMAAMPGRSGVTLELRPQPQLARELFNQVFLRSGESMNGPEPAAMPLLLQRELDGAVSGALTPDALLALARDTGLESPTFELRCMAHRRVSEPGLTRQVFFVRFEWPAFDEFRKQIAQRLRAGGRATDFEPTALSPILIIAASDAGFSSWLPLKAGTTDDCLAPIAVR